MRDFRDGPLDFIPKPGTKYKGLPQFPGFGKIALKDKVPVYIPPKAKPVTYSFDYTEDSAERNYNSIWDTWGGNRKNFDESQNNINLETIPGP